jgi:Replication-relaxation
MAVTTWSGPRTAAEWLEQRVRPDGRLLLQTAAGAVIECLVEWDRATEPAERLAEKLARYRIAERKLRYHDRDPRSVLFIVPGDGRLETLRRLPTPGSDDDSLAPGRWRIFATTLPTLRRDGPLARIWEPINRLSEPPRALTELPARSHIRAADSQLALGRRWRHNLPGFWERLSPLGATDRDLRSSAVDGSMNDRENDVEEEPWP